MVRLAAFFLVPLLVAAATPRARAEDRSDATAAEQLFNRALADWDAGRPKEACQKFRESMRIDPANGTLMNVARCNELEGRLTEAWSAYREAAVLSRDAGQTERAAIAEAAALRVGLQLPRLRVVVADAPAGVVVSADGRPLRGSMASETLVVPPGTHRISVSAPGRAAYETTVSVPGSSQVNEIVVPPLQRAEPQTQTPLFWTGIATGALGLASLIAGGGVGGALLADPRARDAEEKERAAIALVSVGAALVASGTIMIVLDQTGRESEPRTSSSPPVRLFGSAQPAGGRVTLAVAF